MSLFELSLLLQFHIYTGFLSLLVGPIVHLQRSNKWAATSLGRLWIITTLCSAFSSFAISGPAGDGPTILHLISIYVIGTVFAAGYFFKKGRFDRHQRSMVGAYLGVIVAFLYALRPGRYFGQIWQLFLGQ